MDKPAVAVGSLGGTITMMASEPGGTITPRLGAADLLAAVPALAQVASLEASTLASVPGGSLLPADLFAALQWARSAVEGGAAGVVLVQGTDTLEEAAYLIDLHWERPEPFVMTGAMRSPQVAGSDGPANLLAAVQTAADPRSRELGVLVVLNDEVHAALRVRKMHSTAVQAFASPGFGALGGLAEGQVIYGNRPRRQPALPDPSHSRVPRVALLETSLGDDGELLALATSARYDGIVLAAFGVGHVPVAMAEQVSRAVQQAPVVLATRTGNGPVLTSTYGFVGSESDLLARGVIAAGWLDPRKARVLLWSLLAAHADPQTIREQFARRGQAPAGPVPPG